MSNDLYQEIILEEFRSPQNFGKLGDADLILSGRNASCGDNLTLYLQLDTATQKITDIKWDGEGCAISMATMSVLSQKVKLEQPTLSQLAKLQKQDILELIGLEEITSGREKCLLLGVHVLTEKK